MAYSPKRTIMTHVRKPFNLIARKPFTPFSPHHIFSDPNNSIFATTFIYMRNLTCTSPDCFELLAFDAFGPTLTNLKCNDGEWFTEQGSLLEAVECRLSVVSASGVLAFDD